jgi:hypothetical protein
MSWTASGTVATSGEVDLVVPSGLDATTPGYDLMDQQVKSAHAAAKAIIDSGCVGSGPYYVGISGHANPEHKPREGWANDSVYVSISQITAVPQTSPDPAVREQQAAAQADFAGSADSVGQTSQPTVPSPANDAVGHEADSNSGSETTD